MGMDKAMVIGGGCGRSGSSFPFGCGGSRRVGFASTSCERTTPAVAVEVWWCPSSTKDGRCCCGMPRGFRFRFGRVCRGDGKAVAGVCRGTLVDSGATCRAAPVRVVDTSFERIG